MPERDVLVIAYYFPPMGLSGVQRVVKFVKYLPEFGWRPTVLTVQPGGYFAYDETLMREVEDAGVEVIRTRSADPTRFFGKQKVVGLPAESRRRRLSNLSQWLFVPDNKIGWAPPALKAGRKLLGARRFDLIFSSAPPYTGHLIGERLSHAFGLPLVLDFRDDWLENPRHVYPTALHRRLHECLERRVLTAATRTITINGHIAASLERRRPNVAGTSPVAVIPQGFDAADFDVEPVRREEGVMRLVHAGVFYDKQTPDVLLTGLALFLQRRPEMAGKLEAVFVGLFPEASRRLAERLGISSAVREMGYLPHSQVPSYLLSADALWMTIGKRPGAEGISTGKLFEYFGARKPVLGLVPEGAAAEQLRQYGAAVIADPDDVEAASRALEALYDGWREGKLPVPAESHVRQYERRALAGKLAELFSEACSRKRLQ